MKIVLFIKKHPILLLAIFFVILRWLYLTRLPIFNDEAIYLDWGVREVNSGGALFYSLYDAKPPLLMWLFGLAQIVIQDPLVAGRLVSGCFGFILMCGLYTLGVRFFSKRIAVISSLFYICTPLFLFYDRQALMESAIAAVGIWALYATLCLFENAKARYAVMLGLLIGIGIWIKYNAGIFLVSSCAAAVFALPKKKKERVNFVLCFAIIGIVCFMVVSPLLIQDLFWSSLGSTSRFTLSLSEILHFPLVNWLRNLAAIIEIVFWHISPVASLFGGVGLCILYISQQKSKISVLWFGFTLLFVIITVRTVDPRYIVSYLPYMTIACAAFTSWIIDKSQFGGYALLSLLLLFSLSVDGCMIISPQSYFSLLSNVTQYSQKRGYVDEWTSGYGVPETVSFFNSVAKNGEVLLALQMTTGNPESAMFTYFSRGNIIPFYLHPSLQPHLSESDCLSARSPIYFVSRGNDMGGNERFFDEVKRIYKPSSSSYIGIYKLKPTCKSSKVLQINLNY